MKQNKTGKTAALLFMIVAALFLCACSMINANRAENVMTAKLNDRFGAGNYTISDVRKMTNGEYSLVYTYVVAKVTLNTGEEFSCYVENRDGNYYQYYDYSGTVIFSEDYIRGEIEKSIANIDGVKIKSVSTYNYPKVYDFYDSTQAKEYFDLLGSQGWECGVTFEIDLSLSPEEAVDVAKQVMVSTDNCMVPNIEEFFDYGETSVAWGCDHYQAFQVGDAPITEETVLAAFEIEVKMQSEINGILNQRYAQEGYTITHRDGLIGQYRLWLEVDGKEIQGIYDGTTYRDNYVEVFRKDDVLAVLKAPETWIDGIKIYTSHEFGKTEEKYDGDLSEYFSHPEDYDFDLNITADHDKLSREEATRAFCRIYEYYESKGIKPRYYFQFGLCHFYVYEGERNQTDLTMDHDCGEEVKYDVILDYMNTYLDSKDVDY